MARATASDIPMLLFKGWQNRVCRHAKPWMADANILGGAGMDSLLIESIARHSRSKNLYEN